MTTIKEFQVRKDKLAETRLVERLAAPLGDGEARAKIDRFALTANNVTYGVVGERIGYWSFFPAGEDLWGLIPVWGIAEIEESNNPDIPPGERLYGYWPMASHLVMKPVNAKPTRVVDGADHRTALPPVYNNYQRVAAEPGYDPQMDDERMVLFPLYATSFCIYDFLKDNDWYGAEQIIILSASSKTAIGTAYALRERVSPLRCVGLTSPRNRDALEALDLYDDIFVYDDLEARVRSDRPSVIADMSGDGGVLGRLHKHLGDNMKYTSNVGVTHYDEAGMGPDFISGRSAMFFAPGHIQKRATEWGAGAFEKQAHAFWKEAAIKSRAWLNIKKANGAAAVEKAWHDVLAGKTPANAAWVVGF